MNPIGNPTRVAIRPARCGRRGPAVAAVLHSKRIRHATTPAKAVEAIRLDTARRLKQTTARIETITGDCGLSGEEQMRLAFVRSLGIPPRKQAK